MRAQPQESRITPAVIVLTGILTLQAVVAGGLGLTAQRLAALHDLEPPGPIAKLVTSDRVAAGWFVSLVVLTLTIYIGRDSGAGRTLRLWTINGVVIAVWLVIILGCVRGLLYCTLTPLI